ncbi:MAG: galactokinase, partial [Deltaproteobacteria bacterium]|nr:galactokinase [Deltaproteobacteria bacterium]
WTDYLRGVAHVLESEGHKLIGADLLVESTIPLGAGLSSSAALEVAAGLALLSLADIRLAPLKLAEFCQRAENEFVGTRCGIMDQISACLGRSGQAMLIDCQSLDIDYIPMDESQFRMVVVNTMVKHELAGSKYNQRRAECEEGVRILSQLLPAVRSLRDVTPERFGEMRGNLPEDIRARCQHVIFENERTKTAARYMRAGDLWGVGELMAESHRSLRDEYQVSCAELDLLVELAEGLEGVFGARMTGGGFGGCTINLVASQSVNSFCEKIADGFQKTMDIKPDVHVCRTADGTGEVVKGKI